jgi:uncharacterized protein (DUF924 family)
MTHIATPKEILEFWFSDRVHKLWFNSTPEFDQELRDRFLQTYIKCMNNELKEWEDTTDGALTLVIVLDQFPLNMFRGKPESFATEAAARQIAETVISRGDENKLSDEQKAFLYLPFVHSENLDDQNRSVALYEQAGLIENLKYAKHHRELIKRFGRFPHRNTILGRENTAEELAYLNSKDAFLG